MLFVIVDTTRKIRGPADESRRKYLSITICKYVLTTPKNSMTYRVDVITALFIRTQKLRVRQVRLYTIPNTVQSYPCLYNDSQRSIRDLITPSRTDLLNLTLDPYLPKYANFQKLSSSLPPAYHFIYFPTSTSELANLPDGYEAHFAPTRPFERRIWTQGKLEFGKKSLIIGGWAQCLEVVHKVADTESATDVWIERKIFNGLENNWTDDWSVRELRCLRYLHIIPPVEKTFQARISSLNPGKVNGFSHTFTPSRILLRRFSFLTHNFHLIHIDKDYAQREEKYPDVLMQGSLSVTLILIMVRQFYEALYENFSILRTKYVMYRPLYVNRPVTLVVASSGPERKRAMLLDDQNAKAVECIIIHSAETKG